MTTQYDGVSIPGHKVHDNTFNATINEGLLLKILEDPRNTEKKASIASNVHLQELQRTREMVQRGFLGGKRTKTSSPIQNTLSI